MGGVIILYLPTVEFLAPLPGHCASHCCKPHTCLDGPSLGPSIAISVFSKCIWLYLSCKEGDSQWHQLLHFTIKGKVFITITLPHPTLHVTSSHHLCFGNICFLSEKVWSEEILVPLHMSAINATLRIQTGYCLVWSCSGSHWLTLINYLTISQYHIFSF